MRQTLPSRHENSLLAYAASKLNPEVFSHPVWVRFGKQEAPFPLDLIDNLLGAAEKLETSDPGAVCQTLLLCAVYQNAARQHQNAFKSTQKALALAEHTGLFKETIWARWGMSSTAIQQGNYDQAMSHLADLQDALIQQNEWILADFIDILKQSLGEPVPAGKHSGSPRDPPVDDLLALTFDWLQRWGSFQAEPDLQARDPKNQTISRSTTIQDFFSVRRWQDRWHTFWQLIRGASRLPREKSGAPSKQRLDSDIPSHPLRLAPINEEGDLKYPLRQANTLVPVTVHMLGAFSLTIGELPVKLPASRGLSLLKYLLLHHKQNIPREVLMDNFWPEVDPETARNNLNVAIHSLRTALRRVIFLPVIIFEDGSYGLAQDLQVWLDVEEFERYVKAGQRQEAQKQTADAAAEYEAAISLYQGDFLVDTQYESWTVLDRERLRIAYLDTLAHLSQIYFNQERYAACVNLCQLILARDRCREDAHCRLMQCYSRLGQGPLALRQYQICVEALQAELQVDPAPETTRLYEQIRRHNQI